MNNKANSFIFYTLLICFVLGLLYYSLEQGQEITHAVKVVKDLQRENMELSVQAKKLFQENNQLVSELKKTQHDLNVREKSLGSSNLFFSGLLWATVILFALYR